jgi:hypothetical protein
MIPAGRKTLLTGVRPMNEEQPRDHAPDTGDETDAGKNSEPGDIQQHIKSRTTWLRLLFMLVLVLIYGVSRLVVGAVVLLQFLWVLFTGETNERLRELGQSLATYTYQVIRYLTYNTDSRPFPFDDDWPSSTPPIL